MERFFQVDPTLTVIIEQEFVGSVNAVVWDAAISCVHYFIRQGSAKWRGKRVIELGAGTGVVGLMAAALGAEVVLTDLPEYLPLLEHNLSINPKLRSKVTISALDWSSYSDCSLLFSSYDVVLLVDCIYYRSVVPCLINLLKTLNCSEILCAYEQRDIGEPIIAQENFLQTITNDFSVHKVKDDELDPNYVCDEIVFLRLIKK